MLVVTVFLPQVSRHVSLISFPLGAFGRISVEHMDDTARRLNEKVTQWFQEGLMTEDFIASLF